MALLNVKPVQHLECCFLNRTDLELFKANSLPMQSRGMPTPSGNLLGLAWKPLIIEAKFRKRAISWTESAKIRNRRLQQKYNGTPTKPRLLVFCSDKQLRAMLVDDAAKVVGEELVKAAMNMSIDEIASYDRNGCVRGEKVKAFEIALSQHDTLPLLAIACFGERPPGAPWLRTTALLLDDLNDESLDY
ncbi:50S ribosomal protein L18 [Bienertia sinuspersici]